ncbi:Tetratricopeptide-like helical [Corchorus olitorius]|uniref:Tetratricopeptide-like helical n=1 Tax=Corchorus olitorius TaxID=93759 RepID=A0A1R3L0I8_9ROSI|nr:Tetratricopeptide-like helical [Corchorus olitorius]
MLEICYSHVKARGDEAVGRMDYHNAILCYSEALTNFPTDPAVIYSNRSLCWIRLNKGKYALEDAKCCIKRRPNWPKAHYCMTGKLWKPIFRIRAF